MAIAELIIPKEEKLKLPSYLRDLQSVLLTIPENGVRVVEKNGKGL